MLSAPEIGAQAPFIVISPKTYAFAAVCVAPAPSLYVPCTRLTIVSLGTLITFGPTCTFTRPSSAVGSPCVVMCSLYVGGASGARDTRSVSLSLPTRFPDAYATPVTASDAVDPGVGLLPWYCVSVWPAGLISVGSAWPLTLRTRLSIFTAAPLPAFVVTSATIFVYSPLPIESGTSAMFSVTDGVVQPVLHGAGAAGVQFVSHTFDGPVPPSLPHASAPTAASVIAALRTCEKRLLLISEIDMSVLRELFI